MRGTMDDESNDGSALRVIGAMAVAGLVLLLLTQL